MMDRLDADTIECVRQLANLVALQQNTRILPETFRTALADRQYSIMRDAGLKRCLTIPSKMTPLMNRICRTFGLPLCCMLYWID